MSNVRPALALSVAAEYTTQLMNFISVVILARLLTPEEIGIFSLALSVVLVAQELRSFGVGQFVIQERELSEDKIRSATGVLFLTSWTLAALLAGGSGAIASYYEEPGLRAVMLVLACSFLVMPFNGATDAYLRRQMAFGKIYRVKVAANIVQVSAVLSLAFIGFGYMSMAWAALLGTMTSVLVLNYYRPDYVPFVPGFSEFRRIFSFGSFASAAGILRQVAAASPEVIIGRVLSMADVGYFSRALGLIRIFERAVLAGVRPVMLPHFSAKREEGNREISAAYLKSVSFVTCVAWPFYGFVALMAYPVIRILYGDQWDAAVPVAQALCIGGAFQGLMAFAGQALVAQGAIRHMFTREAIVVPIRIGLILVGVQKGLIGVGLALGAAGAVGFLVSSVMIRRVLGIRMRVVLRASGRSLAVTGYAMAVPLAVVGTMTVGPESYWIPFAIAAVGAAVGWVLGVLVVGHEMRVELWGAWAKIRGSALLRSV